MFLVFTLQHAEAAGVIPGDDYPAPRFAGAVLTENAADVSFGDGIKFRRIAWRAGRKAEQPRDCGEPDEVGRLVFEVRQHHRAVPEFGDETDVTGNAFEAAAVPNEGDAVPVFGDGEPVTVTGARTAPDERRLHFLQEAVSDAERCTVSGKQEAGVRGQILGRGPEKAGPRQRGGVMPVG